MTNLLIKDDKATTIGKPPFTQWFGIKKMLEGRVTLHKTGEVSFIATQHNVETWLARFPGATVEQFVDENAIVDDFLSEGRPAFKMKRVPRKWQKEADDKIGSIIDGKGNVKAYAFLYDPGGGKSASLCNLIGRLYCTGNIDAAIIVTPSALVSSQWAGDDGALKRDIQDDIPLNHWLWDKSRSKKSKAEYETFIQSDGLQVIILNVDAVKTPHGQELLSSFVKRHKGRVLMAVDEIHLIANPSSGRHKKCNEIGKMCHWRSGLTGTPLTRDITSAFGIFRFLDNNILGMKYMTTFKSHYCITRWNGFADQVIGAKNLDKFYECIAPYSTRITSQEMGLELVPDQFFFDLSEEQRKHFDRVKNEWITALDNGEFASASIALSAAIKLQQIANGYLLSDDGTVQLLHNARMEAFDAWLETIPDEKIVVWVRFRQDGRLLMEHLKKQAVLMTGDVSEEELHRNKDRFIGDSDIRFMVASPDRAGTGLDGLQSVCNRAVYYSTSENRVLRRQSELRILRLGGSATAFTTDLVARKSGDKKILDNLAGKNQISTMAFDQLREWFDE